MYDSLVYSVLLAPGEVAFECEAAVTVPIEESELWGEAACDGAGFIPYDLVWEATVDADGELDGWIEFDVMGSTDSLPLTGTVELGFLVAYFSGEPGGIEFEGEIVGYPAR